MTTIGVSTGAWKGFDVTEAYEASIQNGLTALELSALRWEELGSILDFAVSANLNGFHHLSVHLPSRMTPDQQREAAGLISRPELNSFVFVAHPEAITVSTYWSFLGPRLLIENMDVRKSAARTGEELSHAFNTLPEAGLCFDLAHARQVDPTMTVAVEILRRYGSRLRQLHLSDVDSKGQHQRLSWPSIRSFRRLVPQISLVPIVVESPIDTNSIKAELSAVNQIWQLDNGLKDLAVYVSSKIKHAEKWRALRHDGWNISASWIDYPVETDPDSLSWMWDRFVDECRASDVVLVYREPGEQLKGALIEIGAALAGGARVVVVGDVPELGSSHYHPLVKFESSLESALNSIKAMAPKL